MLASLRYSNSTRTGYIRQGRRHQGTNLKYSPTYEWDRDSRIPLGLCFLDYKSFGCVIWDKYLWSTFEEVSVPSHLVALTECVLELFEPSKGMRQGNILSPVLYYEMQPWWITRWSQHRRMACQWPTFFRWYNTMSQIHSGRTIISHWDGQVWGAD